MLIDLHMSGHIDLWRRHLVFVSSCVVLRRFCFRHLAFSVAGSGGWIRAACAWEEEHSAAAHLPSASLAPAMDRGLPCRASPRVCLMSPRRVEAEAKAAQRLVLSRRLGEGIRITTTSPLARSRCR